MRHHWRVMRDGSNLLVTVEDTGVGIEQHDLARLGGFLSDQPRATTADMKGRGSGCRSSNGLVKLHDGEVDIRSGIGEGTRVTVRLPIGQSDERTPTEPVKLVTESHRGNPVWLK